MRFTTAPAARLTGVTVLLLAAVMCALSTPTTATVSYNASEYVNADVAVNALQGAQKVVLLAKTSPSDFDGNSFSATLYKLYAAADSAITSLSCVSLVNWCGVAVSTLNNTMSCTSGSANNQNASYTNVYMQVQLCGWAKTTALTPNLVDLTSAGVTSSLMVTNFPGIADPDKNTTGTDGSYISNITSNSAALYAVFGVLIGVAVLSLVGVAVCVCVCDSRHANRNRSIIDRAIQAVRGDKKRQGGVTFTEYYNLGADTTGPTPAPTPSYSTTMKPTGTDGYTSREGADSREMQDVNGSRAADFNGHNGKSL